jgi:ribosome-binding factor A
MTGFSRAQRVGGLIQKILAELLHKDLSDPRLHLTTVTQVTVTRDLRIARVYFATAGGKETAAAAAEGFASAAGFIKRRLGRELGLRYMPQLEFFYDESLDHGARIDQLLKSIAVDTEDAGDNGSDPSTH